MSTPTPQFPANPSEGQLWMDNDTKVTWEWSGTKWYERKDIHPFTGDEWDIIYEPPPETSGQ